MPIPLDIICGPPGAGKSTYIQYRDRSTTLVIDFAEIKARVSGLRLYEAGDRWVDATIKERAHMLSILTKETPHTSAVFVTLAPERCVREDWAEQLEPDRVIVLETDPHLCIERIKCSPVRSVHTDLFWRTLVYDWWAKYVRNETDIIVKNKM